MQINPIPLSKIPENHLMETESVVASTASTQLTSDTLKIIFDHLYTVDREQGLIAMAPICKIPSKIIKIFQMNGEELTTIGIPQDHNNQPVCHDISFSGNNLIVSFSTFDNLRNKGSAVKSFDITRQKWLHTQDILGNIDKNVSNKYFIVVGCYDGTLFILKADTLEILQKLQIDTSEGDGIIRGFKDLQIHDNKLVCLLHSHRMIIIDLQKLSSQEELPTPASEFIGEGNFLFIAHSDKPAIELWDIQRKRCIQTLTTADKVTKLYLESSQEHACLAAGLSNGQVQVWNHSSHQSNLNAAYGYVRDGIAWFRTRNFFSLGL